MNVEITALSNGLTVITDPCLSWRAPLFGVWVNAGARNETQPVMGVSHMLEHMAFKGTRAAHRARHRRGDRSGRRLPQRLHQPRADRLSRPRAEGRCAAGAWIFWPTFSSSPTFDQAELERERQVVLQEIGQARDTPDDIVFDHLQAVAYPGAADGLADPRRRRDCRDFSRDDLRTYMGANYRAGGMIFVASGAVEHGAMVALVAEKFAGLEPGDAPSAEPARYVGGECASSEDLEQVHVAYAFPGVSSTDPDFYAAQVYATALGGGMSSRLFQEAREKRGLCYSIYAFAQSFSDGGTVGVYTGTGESGSRRNLRRDRGRDGRHCGNCHRRGSRARQGADEIRPADGPGTSRDAGGADRGANVHLRPRIPIAEFTAKLDAVDAAAVRRFGERMMNTDRPSIAAVGPRSSLESLRQVRAADSARRARPRRGMKTRAHGVHAGPDLSRRPAAGDPRRRASICAIRAWPIICVGAIARREPRLPCALGAGMGDATN